jgi:hypothetical protein
MKPDARIWEIAAYMISRHGLGAEREAVSLANRMLDHGDRQRQIEWLRVLMAIGLIRTQPATSATPAAGTGA